MPSMTKIVRFFFGIPSSARENVLLDPEFWGNETVQDVVDAIDQGANVRAYDRGGSTPLHFATGQSFSPETVALLLDKGADVEACDKHGQTPLYAAVGSLRGHRERGTSGEILEVSTPSEMVKLLLDRGANVKVRDKRKVTPLHVAAMCSETTVVVTLLLDRGADPLARDVYGETPYDYAQKNISSEKNSISWKIHNAQRQQESPSSTGRKKKQSEIDDKGAHKLLNSYFLLNARVDDVVKILANGADVNARDEEERTPLLLALEKNLPELPLVFLDHSADTDVSDSLGRTPLHLATKYANTASNYDEFIGAFLERSTNVNINAPDEEGRTPLHWAAVDSGIQVIEQFLERGADIHARDNEYRTHLHWAAAENSPEAVALFLEKGINMESRTTHGQTPLHQAVAWNSLEVAELLLGRGADIEAQDNDGQTPLHIVAKRGQRLKMIEFLLNKGANIEACTKEGQTALHLTAGVSETPEMIALLLDRGANAAGLDKNEKSPFDYVEESGNLKGSDVYRRLKGAHPDNEQQINDGQRAGNEQQVNSE